MPYDVTFNTTASFITNTNWQFYAGETTLSNLQQMAGLAVQNFVSAAVGIAVAIAFIRALAARSGKTHRQLLRRPLQDARLRAAADLGRGRPRPRLAGRHPVAERRPGRPRRRSSRSSAPTAAASSTSTRRYPFENPTWLSNFIEMLLILAIPAALTSIYGRMVGNRRQGWAIYAAMLSLFVVGVVVVGDRREPRRRPRWTPPASTASTWRARSSASASPRPRCAPSSRPSPRAAPSTARWSRSPASAASSRWPTCRPAR